MPLASEVVLAQLQVAAFLLMCGTLGLAAMHRFGLGTPGDPAAANGWLRASFALSSGLAIHSTALFALGCVGLLRGPVVLATLLLLQLWAVSVLTRAAVLSMARLQSALRHPQTWLAIALGLWFALVAVRAPGHWDDTTYHLPLARHYQQQGALSVHPFLRYPLFPQDMEVLFALGLMQGSDGGGAEVAAQTLATLPLFVLSLGLAGAGVWARQTLIPGLAAVPLLVALGPVAFTLGYAYVDNGLAMYSWGAYLALALWEQSSRQQRGWLVIAGLLAGAAVATKFFGVIPAFLIGLWLLRSIRTDARPVLIYAAVAGLIGGGWYLRSWVLSGDPIHPLGGPVFGFYLWDAQDLQDQIDEQGTYGVRSRTLWNFWPALKVAGVAPFGLALIWGVLAWRACRSLRLLYGMFVANLLFWYWSSQVERYLAPVYGLGCLFTVLLVWDLGRLLPGRPWRLLAPIRHPRLEAPVVVILAAVLLVTAWSQASDRLAGWPADLARRPGYEFYERANELAAEYGDRLTQAGFRNGVWFFRGTVIGDWFGPGRLRQFADCAGSCRMKAPEVVAERMRVFGSRMLLVNRRQFPLDLDAYREHFDVQLSTDRGVLLTLKAVPTRSSAPPPDRSASPSTPVPPPPPAPSVPGHQSPSRR
jgi:hypothetical protein